MAGSARPHFPWRWLERVAAAPPIPRPGESLPAATPPLQAGSPLTARPARRARLSEVRTSLTASHLEGGSAELFGAFAGGAVLTGWALHLGAGPFLIGLLGALPLAGQILQLPAAWLTQGLGSRPVAIVAVGASRLIWLPMVALPFLPLSPRERLGWFLAVVALSAMLGVAGNNAWTAWMGALVPGRIRGRYFSRRTIYISVSGTLASLAAASVLDAAARREATGTGLAALAAMATLAGAVSVALLRRQHDPGPAAGARAEWNVALAPFADPRARTLIRYLFGWNAAIGVAAGFFAFHMLQNLRSSFVLAAAHGVVVAGVRILAAPVWGAAVDRVGARPVLTLTSFGIAAVPVIWLLATPDRLWPLAVEAVLAGALWGGHGIAIADVTVTLSPSRGRAFYLGAFAAVGGAGFALASVLAGLLAQALPATFRVGGLPWVDLHVLFLLSALARLLAALLASRIDEPDGGSVQALLVGSVAPGQLDRL
jgi:hypothetical protein